MKKISLSIVGVIFSCVLLSACQQQTMQSSQNSQYIAGPTDAGEEIDPQQLAAESQTLGRNYVTYSPDAVATATARGKAVLFFHAPWCPTCRAANQEFIDDGQDIPTNITVIRTDYDTYAELKKKYGVTYQHTFVQVDADGNLITKWNGGGIAELSSKVK